MKNINNVHSRLPVRLCKYNHRIRDDPNSLAICNNWQMRINTLHHSFQKNKLTLITLKLSHMNIIKKLLLLTCPLLIGHSAYAQEVTLDNLPTNADIMQYTPSPQTWAFMRYGSTPIDYYTGKAMIDVPIYTYKDKDFELPISVGYASEGFIPSRQTGILGLNWFLNCGGSISREIKGIPDDCSQNECGGFLISDSSDSDIYNLNGTVYSKSPVSYQVNNKETTSDIYHFNFGGHKGTFHFNGNRDAIVYNTNGFHGTFTIIPICHTNGELMGFIIKTGDGYKYVFGSDDLASYNNCVERSINGELSSWANFNLAEGANEFKYPIVTWNLTQIIAPNNRTVDFKYLEPNGLLGTYINRATENNPFLVATFTNSHDNYHWRSVSFTRTCYLDKVIIDDDNNTDDNENHKTIIRFTTSLKDCYDRPESTRANSYEDDHLITQNLYKLDEITVTNPNNKQIHKTSFTYKTKNDRLILTKITTDGLGDYTMSYHEEYPYPAISTADTDFWGFYNGRRNNYSNVNGSEVNEYFNDKISSDRKMPDWKHSRIGCIKQITYPTNGFTEFEYESNKADNILLKREVQSGDIQDGPINPDISNPSVDDTVGYLVGLHSYGILFNEFTDSNETGGIRIKKITDYDGLGGFQSRELSYWGGTVYSFPKWYTAKFYGYQVYNPLLEYPINSLDKQHIGYANVKENFADGSFIIHYYNDYRSYPDEYNGQQRREITTADITNVNNPKWNKYISNILREPNSNHNKRGKLNCQEYYNTNRELVKKIQYEYNVHSEDFSPYVVLSGKYAYSVKRYIGDYRLTKIKDIEYYGDNSITTSHCFSYDSLGRQITTITKVNNSTIKKKMQYISDTTRHIYNLPTAKLTIRKFADGTNKLCDATLYDYMAFDSLLCLSKIRTAQISDNTNYVEGLPNLEYTEKQSIVNYDSYGNPTEVVDEHGVHTAYLWGYNGMYPIVKVKNLTSEHLKQALNIESNDPLPGALDGTLHTNLYSVANTLVDIYEYEPLVGMTKHYDNNSKCTTYEYDSYSRLSSVTDSIGSLVRYRYNTSNTSDTITPPIWGGGGGHILPTDPPIFIPIQ